MIGPSQVTVAQLTKAVDICGYPILFGQLVYSSMGVTLQSNLEYHLNNTQ